jgi:acyl-CoA reductase-like NAD-dependent aldehyde dehydrogenase
MQETFQASGGQGVGQRADRSITECFAGQVARHGDRTAVKSENESITYVELDRYANCVAHALLDRASKADDSNLCAVVKTDGVPSVSRLWRDALERETRGLGLSISLIEVDNAAYQLVNNARQFDEIVAPNMFGDVLGDVGALLLGSRGMSFSGNFGSDGRAVYQTAHGAAFDIAGRDLAGEAVFHKNVFNAFYAPGLANALAEIGADTVIVAGVHLHACVRETALAAYQAGYRVWLADDAVGTYDVLHGEITRDYLRSRDISFMPTEELLRVAGAGGSATPAAGADSGWIGGSWMASGNGMRWERRNPSRWDEVLGMAAEATDAQIESAVAGASRAQREWGAREPESRAECLRKLAQALQNRGNALTQAMVTEIGKPRTDAEEEVARAVQLVRAAIERFETPRSWERHGEGVHSRRAPVGVVAAVTPFNHPLGIPIGKIAPALALGNAVVWKPALAAVATTRLAAEALVEAEIPYGVVSVVFGDRWTAQRLARMPQVTAVTVTASIPAGKELAAICGASLKPIQAELGGNNAVVVMGDVDIERIAREIALSAFGFAGQRCTAGRRVLVERGRYARLVEALAAETEALCVGDPGETATVVGPVVSRDRQAAAAQAVAGARRAGARVVCGGGVPAGMEHGCWFSPTLVTDVSPASALFREETFGPVAVVHPVADFAEAISLVNAVEHGLVATLYSEDEALQGRFLAEVEAGVVKFNRQPGGVDEDAPFGGWKSSGLGPPEHGRWDAEFYTRAQALYGFGPLAPVK